MDRTLQRGSVLIQVILVVGLLVALGALAIASMGKRVAGERSGEVIATEARELTQIGEAMRRLAQRASADWPVDEPQTFDVADLQAEGLLPGDFALREPTPGTSAAASPFFQPYRAVAIKDDAGVVRTVVRETGAAAEARVIRVGATPNAEGLANLKDQIAARVIIDGETPAGIVRPGSTTAHGTLNGFTKDLAAWLGSAPEEAIAVALIGFPDLDGAGGSDPGGTTPPGSVGQYVGCQLVQPTLFQAPATCPAGTVQAAAWPMCAPINPYHTKYVAYPSDVGTMTSGVRETRQPEKILCSPEIGPISGESNSGVCRYTYFDTPNWQDLQKLRRDVDIAVITSINSGELVENGCASQVYGVKDLLNGTCNYERPNAPPWNGWKPRFSGEYCENTILNNVMATKKAAAMNALCCTPRT